MPRPLAPLLTVLLAGAIVVLPVPATAESPAAPDGRAESRSAPAPSRPTIDTPAEGSTVSELVVTGTADPRTVVQVVLRGGEDLGTDFTRPDGTYTITVRRSPPQAAISFRVASTNGSGVTSSSDVRNVTVRDSTPPRQPELLAPADRNQIAKNRTVLGVGERGATIRATIDGVAVSNPPKVDADFQWRLVVPSSLPEGRHVFVLSQVDAAGNVSEPLRITLNLDVQTPGPPVITSPPSGQTSENDLRVVGTGEPGAKLGVRADGTYLFWTIVEPDGSWAVRLQPDLNRDVLTRGGHWFSVSQEDRAGNRSTGTGIRYVIRDTEPPMAPVFSIQQPGEVFTVPRPVLDVYLDLDATMTWTVDGRPQPDFVGNNPRPNFDLASGEHTIRAYNTDSSGNRSETITYRFVVRLPGSSPAGR